MLFQKFKLSYMTMDLEEKWNYCYPGLEEHQVLIYIRIVNQGLINQE